MCKKKLYDYDEKLWTKTNKPYVRIFNIPG